MKISVHTSPPTILTIPSFIVRLFRTKLGVQKKQKKVEARFARLKIREKNSHTYSFIFKNILYLQFKWY